MTATQLPKPGDRFRWYHSGSAYTVAAVDEFNAYYRDEDGDGYACTHAYWLKHAIPIPPKPHVEPVQWGYVTMGGWFSAMSTSEETVRRYVTKEATSFRGVVARLDHGVLFVEVGGEFVRAFEDGAG